MQISNIAFKNIKSFDIVNLNLNNFNVLIGSCASGKSNFIDLFKFIKDLSEDFQKAITNSAGLYLKNFNSPDEDECYLKITLDGNNSKNYTIPVFKEDTEIFLEFSQIEYELHFNFKSMFSYEILKEKSLSFI